MKVQGKLFRVTSRNDIQGSLWGRIKIVDHGTIWVSNFFGQLPTIHGSPSSQRLISYILSYAFDKTIKRDTKCFEKSFLASAHPRLICYQLLLIFSEMNFSRSHFRWYCITHVLFNSFQTNIGFYSQHKKWSFRLRISSINVTKSSGSCTFAEKLPGKFNEKLPGKLDEKLPEKLHFLRSGKTHNSARKCGVF